MNHIQQRLLDFLKREFDPDGTIHLLTVAAVEQRHDNPCPEKTYKVRIALTYQDDSGMNPFFDGTDLFVVITPADIRFTQEEGGQTERLFGKEVRLNWHSAGFPN